MRRTVLLLSLLLAAPAVAQQPINGVGQASSACARDVHWDLRRIDRRTDRARENGEIDRQEARNIQRERRLIRSLAGRYAADGLSESELRELQTRTFILRDMANAPGRPTVPPPPPR